MFFLPYGLRAFIASSTFFCCNLFAAYHSYKALKHRQLSSSTHWLFYWTLVASFLIVDKAPLSHEILHSVIPFFPELRVALHLFTIHHPTKALAHLVQWLNVVAESIRLKHWITFTVLVAVRGLRNLIKMGVLDDAEVSMLEALNKSVSEVSFDVAVVRNKKRNSIKLDSASSATGEVPVVTGRRSLHSSHFL